MKKEALLQSEVCKITKMKKHSRPYLFLSEMFGEDLALRNPLDLTIEQLLKVSPKEIREHFGKTCFNSYDWQRSISKSLRLAKEKLSKLGFKEKDGPFMSGIYFVTEWSPREDWVQYFMSEYEVSKKEAESAYDIGKKFNLI